MPESRLPKTNGDSVPIEQKANVVVRAIFFHFQKNKLSMDGAMLVLAAAYAMLLNQCDDEKQKKDLADLFEKMVAKSKPGKIIVPGEN